MFSHFPTDEKGSPSQLQITDGLNLEDNLLEMQSSEAAMLREMLYKKNTPIQREPFSKYSTVDYSLIAPFKGSFEYNDLDGNKRLLTATDNGKILEWTAAGTNADRVTGLTVSMDGRFAPVLGHVVVANGADEPRAGLATAWRVYGAPARVTTFGIASVGVGSFNGNYLHIIIPVIESDPTDSDADAVGLVFGDWSDIQLTSASNIAQFGLIWTDVADARINKYWVYRTKVGLSGPFFRVARVAAVAGVSGGTFGDTVAEAALSAVNPPIKGVWGTAPIGKYVVFSGSRVVMANLETVGAENAFHVSQACANAYDGEAFPTSRHRVICFGQGPIKGILAIGDTGGEAKKANHLFIAQEKSCYLLPDTDPFTPLIEISGEIGLLNDQAIAQWGTYIFWVDRKKGLCFWRVGQDSPWEIGDKIRPIFFGGGNENLTANQGDSNISLEVWNDQLLITVRDDITKTGGNKAYVMDLNAFQPVDRLVAKRSARFTGPWTIPCAYFLALSNKTLLCFDNQNKAILYYDTVATQDNIGGVLTNVKPKIKTAAILKGSKTSQKLLRYAYIYHFTNTAVTLRVMSEYLRVVSEQDVDPTLNEFTWEDITWDDIEWIFSTWAGEASIEWGTEGRWFQLEFEKDDQDKNYAFFGIALKYTAVELIRTFR